MFKINNKLNKHQKHRNQEAEDEDEPYREAQSVEPEIPLEIFKIVVLGDANVGKTEIVRRCCGEPFASNYNTTIGVDFRVKNIQIENKIVKLQMWDTAGHERFRTMTKVYYRGAHGVLFVYDISNQDSFENVRDWIVLFNYQATNLFGRNIEKMLVGNKIDKGFDRQVSKERGMTLAMKHNMKFIETSAMTKEGIDSTFEILAQGMKHWADVERIEQANDSINRPNDTVQIFSDLGKCSKSKKCLSC